MAKKVYHDLCEVLAKRRGRYPGKDIPEFYSLVEELFTPEEAAAYNEIPKGFNPAEVIAKAMGKSVDEVRPNCCSCHCMILKTALAQPKPGLSLNSGFKPQHGSEKCMACGSCIDRCPTEALVMGDEDVPVLNSDLCIGCGGCATGCDFEAITLVARADILPLPLDQRALLEAVKASQI